MVKLTQSAYDKLKAELEERIAMREEISAEIEKAREMGDLRENAAYAEAREKQGFNEGRILELEDILNNAEIVEEVHDANQIGIGSIVELELLDKGMKLEYQIVSFNEADPSNFKISDQSPLAKALMNKKKNDIIEVESPNGLLKYKILNIK